MIWKTGGIIKMEEGEPAMRSCWECNGAHEHLKKVNTLHCCWECGRYWVFDIFLDEFENDKKTLYAVIRCLEVIGEAVKKIPIDIRKQYSDIPWQEISGMRDKLIHEYFGVDIETIWDTIHEDLPLLKVTIHNITNDLK